MCQRMVNHIGMYRIGVKKSINTPVQFGRLMYGVGKKNKKSRDGTSNDLAI